MEIGCAYARERNSRTWAAAQKTYFHFYNLIDKPPKKGEYMDIEKIEKFIDAGYTKAEIDALLSGGNAEPIQRTDEHNEGSGTPEEPEAPKADVVTAEMLKTLTSTVEGLQETVKALQAANVKNADSGSSKVSDPIKETIDSFINEL